MEMRPGYKQSEAGRIPSDWEAVPLSRLGQFKNGINKGGEAFGHGAPFVNLMDVFGVSSIQSGDALGLIKTNEAEQKAYNLKRGDVIFIRSSVKPSGVGLTAVVETELPKTVYSGFLIRFRDNNVLDIGFKRHCFYSESFRSRLLGVSSVSANTNISQENLKKLLIAFPPSTAEQRAIAAALSDVDALLDGLERLIAKKRDLKQATMQQLLTGQTRLPGFSGAWQVKRLSELADIRSGGTPSTAAPQFWDGDIPWCTPTDITALDGRKYLRGSSRMITPQGLKSSSAEMIPTHSIVMTSRATIGECAINTVPVSTNQGFKNFVPFETTDVEFLYYLLTAEKSGFVSLCGGSTFLEIGKTQLAVYQVLLPDTKAEQTAIAAVLSDMDAELSALMARRDKTRALKQSMMQELLTGRTRLV